MEKLITFGLFVFSFLGCGIVPLNAQSKCQKLLNEAYVSYEEAKFKDALKKTEKFIKCDPKSSSGYALKAVLLESLKDSAGALAAHRKCIQSDSLYQPSYFYYAFYLYQLNRYQEALDVLNDFEKASARDGFVPRKHAASEALKDKTQRLKGTCDLALKESFELSNLKIENMGPAINSNLNEYWPGMPINAKVFVYTRLVDMQEDFYFAQKGEDGEWLKSRPAPGRINTPENEGTTSVFLGAENQMLFYTVCNQGGFGSCDLFFSMLEPNGTWGKRQNMGPVVNSAAWDAQPSVSGDGNTLVFASARPGGFGGKDLWVSFRRNGQWGTPVNLGPTVNTEYDEEAPFLHYDGRTLYFSSNGHTGYGGHDLFLTRLGDDNKWGKPENLGKGINTTSDDVGFYVDAFGYNAYFASSRDGGMGGLDIYQMVLPDRLKPQPVNYLLGRVVAKNTGQPVRARVRLVDLAQNKVVYADSVERFLIPIVAGKNYALHSMAQGYLFDSRNFQPELSSLDKPFEVVAELEQIKVDQVVQLRNLFFDVDKFDLKPESETELKVVINLLKANPKMRILIAGHTDNTGSEAHNKTLSENRANSVKSYLTAAGIEANRLQAKGFGSSQPMESNDTDAGKARNRRIEMKILQIN